MPAGRPTDYSQTIADEICELLLDGESLRTICAREGMPARSTVMRWLGVHKEFQDQYARTKQEQAEVLADEIVNISDEREGKAIMADGKEVLVVFDSTAVARNRLRIDARKWVAAKLLPKKYGEKLELEHGGSIQTSSDEQLESRLAELLGKAGVAGAAGRSGETPESA